LNGSTTEAKQQIPG